MFLDTCLLSCYNKVPLGSVPYIVYHYTIKNNKDIQNIEKEDIYFYMFDNESEDL